jgi:hypothetical protein
VTGGVKGLALGDLAKNLAIAITVNREKKVPPTMGTKQIKDRKSRTLSTVNALTV